VGRLERGWRWCRRNQMVASLLAVVVLLMSLGTTVAWVLAARAENEAERAGWSESEALRLKGEGEKEAVAARAAERLARRREYGAGMLLTQSAWEQHQVDRFLQLLEEHRPKKEEDEDFRGFEWFYWKRQFQRGHVTLKGHTSGVTSVAISGDGKRIVSGSYDNTVKVWDADVKA